MRSFFIYISLSLFLLACQSDSSWDCVKKAGKEVMFEIYPEDFHSVTIIGHLHLTVEQSEETKIEIHTRDNIQDNIDYYVEDGVLYIEEKDNCTWVRDKDYTQVYLQTPQLYNIRNASTGRVTSIGTWEQETLSLIAENHFNSSYYNNGVFKMNLKLDHLVVLSNGNSHFQLEGEVGKALLEVYAGNARIEAESLELSTAEVYHRGMNHMLLSPKDSIYGKLLNTGDVRIYTQPNYVDVEELHRGKLIFVE